MNTLNPFAPNTNHPFHNQFTPSTHHHTPMLTKPPFTSLSFKNPLHINASSNSLNPKKNPKFPLSFLKSTIISTITATALIFTKFYLNPKKVISSPLSPPPTMDAAVKEENTENALGEEVLSSPNDVEILKKLLENRVKNRELVEAINVIERLIDLQPDESEWPFLKSHLYVHNGELELAKLGFRDIIVKEPYHVEAYRGLVIAASEDDSTGEMEKIEKMVEEGMEMCVRTEGKESEMRDFKLLLAQIWVIEGRYDDALKVYNELVEEDPKDFRPYLCQGIIYTMLKKKDEAEKYFEKYQGLVPKEDPNARFEFMMTA